MKNLLFLCYLFVCWQSALANYFIAISSTPKYQLNDTKFSYVQKNINTIGAVSLPAIGYFDSLYPFALKNQGAMASDYLLYDTLFSQSMDEPLVAYGLIAKSVSISEDEKKVVFTLNPNATFSDGSRITADDVVASYKILVSSGSHPRYINYYKDILAVQSNALHTVEFILRNKNPELPFIIATTIPIFSKQWIADGVVSTLSNKQPISSGAYLVDKYQFGKFIVYKRNENYWARSLLVRNGMFNFSKITFKYFKDPTIALQALQSGDIDWISESNSKRWATAYNRGGFITSSLVAREFHYDNNAGMQGFSFNLRKLKFQNKNVRKAIALLFDFEWANRHLFYNQYVRSASYFSNSIFGAKSNIQIPESIKNEFGNEVLYDSAYYEKILSSDFENRLKESLRLMEDAGVKSMNIELPLVQGGFERILHRYAYYLSLIGVTLRYKVYDFALYQQKINKFDYDMLVVTFPSGERPGNELYNYFHSKSVNIEGQDNYTGISNTTVDRLIDIVVRSNNSSALLKSTNLLDRVLMSQWLVVPNWYLNYHRVAYSSSLKHPSVLPKYYNALEWMLTTWWIEK
ncbi:MAG: extracellular solute-binding protein [Methylacidiphilales bacterium]|nr:extracellular solute-binding protein [Candidatus Methylacidiphilales bacterium]